MKKMLLAGGCATLVFAAAGGVWAYQDSQDFQVANLCVGDLSSDAAVASNTATVALVTVLERGAYDAEATDPGGVQTFKVRTEEVFKGELPAQAEITQSVPGPAGEEPAPDPRYRVLQPGTQYEVALNGSAAQGGFYTMFARPASQRASVLDSYWRAEIAKRHVDKPCDDTSVW